MSDITPTEPTSSERARIEPSPPARRLDALPVMYLVGFVILASALIYMWRHPTMSRSAVQDSARVATMAQQVDALTARLTALEARPQAAATDLRPLESKVAALEARPAAPNPALMEARIAGLEGKAAVDLKPIDGRLTALEARKPVDLGPLENRVAGIERRMTTDGAGLDAATKQIAALTPRLDQVEAQAKQAAAGLTAVSERAQRFGRVQAAGVALEAGQRLGDIPGAPPALARFAHDAPPTEAGLRLSFNTAAAAAHQASQPALTENQPFLDRMWTRAQQSVTVRQGDRVLVGDPIAGVIANARQLLDAGDLAGAVKSLDGLAGPAKAAMADWMGRAQSLLDARAAVAELAARG